MLKNILLPFTDNYSMRRVCCREEDKLSVGNKATLSCIWKKKLKLCFWVWTRMAWPRISEPAFPSKIAYNKSWKTAQNLKYFVTMSLWQFNDLSPMLCHQIFLVQCLLLTYWKLPAFLESIWSVFSSKAPSRVSLVIFIALMVSVTTNWRAWPW